MGYPTNTTLLDNFNRSNETPATTNWLSPSYSGEATGFNLASNQIDFAVGGGAACYNVRPYNADCEVWAKIVQVPASGYVEIRARMQGVGGPVAASDYYSVRLNSDFSLETFVVVDNTPTSIGWASQSFSNGDRIGLRIVGNMIVSYYGNGAGTVWQFRTVAIDTSITSGGYIGLASNDGAVNVDDFGGGNITYTFPQNSIVDPFTRSDENPIASGWSGPLHSSIGQLQIISNHLAPASSTPLSGNGGSWYTTSYGSDMEAYIMINRPPITIATQHCYLFVRLQSLNTTVVDGYGISLEYYDTDQSGTGLNRMDDGSTTGIGVDGWGLLGGSFTNWQAGDGAGLNIIGNRIGGWIYQAARGAWVSIGSAIDSTYTGSGLVGVVMDNGSWLLDDLGGGPAQIPSVATIVDPKAIYRQQAKFGPF